ncbi:MAG: radical SAM protein [Nitrospirae bacterium]|nr:radical SAM protein [Nitrospirota bacterium]
MPGKQAVIEVNANFHHLAGENLFERRDNPRFAEYRGKWAEWPRSFFVGEFPLFIDVEVTSACNLKCPFCATTFRGQKVKKGFITFDLVKKIIDEGSDKGLYGVKFNIRGEPLLHSEISRFVKYGKDKGLIDIYFNTNAMLLTEDVAKRLIDAGLDRLSISFEGYTKEVYERNRIGAVYETVLSNIENMQSLKQKLGVKNPKVRIQTVMLPEIKNHFEEYKDFWQARADELGFLDYKEMKDKKKGRAYPWACPQIWQRMAVWWDGTILPCNHDDDGLLTIGNLNEISIKAAWDSELLRKTRSAHKEGRAHEINACDGCYLRDSEIVKLTEREKIK